MATPVILPKFSMTQETGTLVRWLRKEGDVVEQGDPLLEVETDKVNMEVEAPATGRLVRVSAQEGETLPVTTVIAYIAAPGEQDPPVDAPTSALADTPAAQPAPAAPRATPVAQRVAQAAGLDLSQVPASGPARRIRREDVERYLQAQATAAPVARTRATPAARAAARAAGLDLRQIAGSGPRQRVQATDVQAAKAAQAASAAAADATPAAPVPPGGAGQTAPRRVPLSSLRRTIAARMTQSYQAVPHITLTAEADMSAAEALRAELNAEASEGAPHLSVTALLVKVCAWALLRHPWVNASLRGDEIELHPTANIGVAVALDDGLIVPVIHSAELLGLREIGRRLHDLAGRARQQRLTPADVSGGTFTISNLGMFGIEHFTAIINPPESAILAVGRVSHRQVVVEDALGHHAVIRPRLTLTLSADHRVLDGAVAARFLQDVVAGLERPTRLLA